MNGELSLQVIDKFKMTIGQTLVFYSYMVQGQEIEVSQDEMKDQALHNYQNDFLFKEVVNRTVNKLIGFLR